MRNQIILPNILSPIIPNNSERTDCDVIFSREIIKVWLWFLNADKWGGIIEITHWHGKMDQVFSVTLQICTFPLE